MNESNVMMSLLVLQVVGVLIIILAGILLKKFGEKTKFIDETSNAELLFYNENKLRKIIRKTYALLIGLGIGLCFLFFSLAAMAMIVLYTLSFDLHIIPLLCLITFLLILLFLGLVMPRMFSEKLRTSLKRSPLDDNVFLKEDMVEKLKKPLIIYKGKYY